MGILTHTELDGHRHERPRMNHSKYRTGMQSECFNDWGGRGYADFVPEEVTKTTPCGDRTT